MQLIVIGLLLLKVQQLEPAGHVREFAGLQCALQVGARVDVRDRGQPSSEERK